MEPGAARITMAGVVESEDARGEWTHFSPRAGLGSLADVFGANWRA